MTSKFLFLNRRLLLINLLFTSLTVLGQQNIYHVDDIVEVKGLGGKWIQGKITEIKSITLGNAPSYSYRVLYNPYSSGSKPINDWIYQPNIRTSAGSIGNISPSKVLHKPRIGQYHFFNSNLRTLGYFTLLENQRYFVGTDNKKIGEYKLSNNQIIFINGPFFNKNLYCELIYGNVGTEYEGIVTDIKFVFDKGKSNEVTSYYKYSGLKK
jgi:hypothetical protein